MCDFNDYGDCNPLMPCADPHGGRAPETLERGLHLGVPARASELQWGCASRGSARFAHVYRIIAFLLCGIVREEAWRGSKCPWHVRMTRPTHSALSILLPKHVRNSRFARQANLLVDLSQLVPTHALTWFLGDGHGWTNYCSAFHTWQLTYIYIYIL